MVVKKCWRYMYLIQVLYLQNVEVQSVWCRVTDPASETWCSHSPCSRTTLCVQPHSWLHLHQEGKMWCSWTWTYCHYDLSWKITILCISKEKVVFISFSNLQLSTASVSAILKQQKRKHKKVTVDPYKSASPPPAGKFLPGSRPDNEWIMYHSDRVPDCQEKWEAMEFVDKTHWGYYCWPKYVLVWYPLNLL